VPESEKLLISRDKLNAVLDGMQAVYAKIASNPLIHAAVSANEDLRKLKTALEALRVEVTGEKPKPAPVPNEEEQKGERY
jgi:hypothetical protein